MWRFWCTMHWTSIWEGVLLFTAPFFSCRLGRWFCFAKSFYLWRTATVYISVNKSSGWRPSFIKNILRTVFVAPFWIFQIGNLLFGVTVSYFCVLFCLCSKYPHIKTNFNRVLVFWAPGEKRSASVYAEVIQRVWNWNPGL